MTPGERLVRDTRRFQLQAGLADAAYDGSVRRMVGAAPPHRPPRNDAGRWRSLVGGQPGGSTGASPSAALLAQPEVVDIYLSAGPVVSTPGAADYRSCDLDNVGSCRIYRLGWDFTDMRAADAEEVTPLYPRGSFGKACSNGLGRVQPALSPDRTRLAWTAACHEGPNDSDVHTSEIGIHGPRSIASPFVTPGTLKRGFPVWADDGTLLFQTNDTAGTVWSTDKAGAVVTGVVGPDMGGTGDYKNPRVHPAPGYRTGKTSYGPDGPHSVKLGPKMATFGVDASGFERPQVSNLDGSEPESFSMGADPTHLTCHHPAWNPDGTAIVCQREDDNVEIAPRTYEKGLYRFEWSALGNQWNNVGPLFPSPSPADIEIAMGTTPAGTPLFPGDTTQLPFCATRAWKSPEWCYSEDFVVVTLTCSHPSVHFVHNIFTSRVVLVDMRGTSPVLYDLTRQLEELLGIAEGSYHAIFATCGTPS